MSIQVFQYQSYRDFLRDFVEDKRATKNLSYRYFSQKCGFKRPNYFQSILSGERKLTARSAKAVARGLQLTSLEQTYFEQLVQLSDIIEPAKRASLEQQLEKLRHLGNSAVITGTESFESYLLPIIWELFQLSTTSYWNTVSVREALTLSRVSDTDIERSLQKLASYGLISHQDKQGFCKVKDASFSGPQESLTENGMRDCHRIALRHAAQSLALKVADREMQNLVVAISHQDLPRIKTRIRNFLAELNNELTVTDNTDQVVQIHLSVVPLTQRLSKL